MAQANKANENFYRWWNRFTVFPITIVILIIYFDTFNHYWFFSLLRGYIIKVWLLPFFLFFFFLFRAPIQGNLNLPSKDISHLNLMLVIYVTAGFSALLIHENLWNKVKYGLLMFGPLMMYFSIIYGFRDNKHIERALKLLFLLGIIYAMYTVFLFQFIGPGAWNLPSIERNFMLSDDVAESNPDDYNTYYIGSSSGRVSRSSIPGIDEPKFGGMIAPLVLVGFYYAMNSRKYWRMFYFIQSLFLSYTVIATLSRSSISALLAGLTLFFLSLRTNLGRFTTGLIIFGLITGMLLSIPGAIDRIILLFADIEIFAQTEFINKLIAERGIYLHREGHIISYIEGMKVISQAPLFGVLGIGVQNFEDMFADYRWGVPHNRYMFILNTTGFLTLIPYVGFIIALIVTARRTFRRRLKFYRSLNNLGFIFYPAVVLLAVKLNNEGVETYYYWIFFGLAAAWVRNSAYERKNGNFTN